MNRRRIFAVILLLLLFAGGTIVYLHHLNWLDHSQDAPILAAARRYNVDPALVKAVVWRESRFHPEARGSRGEVGLMQVIPGASARDWADANHLPELRPNQLFNTTNNTLIGAWYLGRLLKRYSQTDSPLTFALADYNAGRGNVLKWQQGVAATNAETFMQEMSFPSTRDYVRSVTRRYEHYRPIFPPKTAD